MSEKLIFVPNNVYQLTSKSSGKVLSVANASKDNGAYVQVINPADMPSLEQLWKFAPANDGFGRLINCQSQKALDIIAVGTENGAWLHQWEVSPEAESQLWMLESCRDGSCKLKSKLSGKCIDIVGMSLENGAQVQIWEDLGGDNQKWFCKDCTDSVKSVSKTKETNKQELENVAEKKVKKEKSPASESKVTKKSVSTTSEGNSKKEKSIVQEEAVLETAKQSPAISPKTPPLKKVDQTTKAIKKTDPHPETSLVTQPEVKPTKSAKASTPTKTTRKRPATDKK